MFTRNTRLVTVGVQLVLALSAATACSTQGVPSDADGRDVPEGPYVATATSTRTNPADVAQANLPTEIPVPQVFVGTSVDVRTSGTYMYPAHCSGNQMNLSVFDTDTGGVVSVNGPNDQLQSAGEKVGDVSCALFRLKGGELYIAYGVNSFKEASGLSPRQEYSRLYTYPLGSSTPKVIEFEESISMVTGTQAGPLVEAADGKLARYSVDKSTPTWTKMSLEYAPYYSDSASIMMGHISGNRLVLDAETGEELVKFCLDSSYPENNTIAIFVPDSCGITTDTSHLGTPWEPDQYALYDLENKRHIGTVSDEDGGNIMTNLISDDYIAFFDMHEPSLLVVDRRTGEKVIVRTGEDADELSLDSVSLFEDRLYLRTTTGTSSVVQLPSGETVATDFQTQPAERLYGWTRVVDLKGPGDVEAYLVRDVEGEYPGPWQ